VGRVSLLNQESQEPVSQRQVKAYIPVESLYKTNDPGLLSVFCAGEAFNNQQVAVGIYADNFGQSFLGPVGTLAISDPNGISPATLFGPPYTNLQASLTLGAASYQAGFANTPFWHFVGGTFGSSGVNGIPTGLVFTNITRWNKLLRAASPFEPFQREADALAVTCGDVNVPFDKHMKDITVPMLYVGAAGAYGAYGLYTLTLLGSEDVSHHIVSFYPPNDQALDYGHADLFTAYNAKNVVWSKILAWLTSHE
jgi:hypothetical protein